MTGVQTCALPIYPQRQLQLQPGLLARRRQLGEVRGGEEPGLKIPAKEPCIRLHRRTWSDGKPVSVVDLTYPGSRFRLSGRFKA